VNLLPIEETATVATADLTLNVADRIVTGPRDWAKLSPAETKLLRILMLRSGEAIRKDALHEACKVRIHPTSPESVDVQICNLRRALRSTGSIAVIRSIRIGRYMLLHALPPEARVTLRLLPRQHAALMSLIDAAEVARPGLRAELGL
jgi:DNA-binding response OmpR family regulator